MTTLHIIAIVIGGVVAYAILAGLMLELTHRATAHWEHKADRELATILFAVFMPLGVPILVAMMSRRALHAWLTNTRLPRAKARRRKG